MGQVRTLEGPRPAAAQAKNTTLVAARWLIACLPSARHAARCGQNCYVKRGACLGERSCLQAAGSPSSRPKPRAQVRQLGLAQAGAVSTRRGHAVRGRAPARGPWGRSRRWRAAVRRRRAAARRAPLRASGSAPLSPCSRRQRAALTASPSPRTCKLSPGWRGTCRRAPPG